MSVNVFASGFSDTFGFSAEGMSQGNAMTATVNDWSSVYYNVAGLGKTGGKSGVKTGSGNSSMSLKAKNNEMSIAGNASKTYANELAMTFMLNVPGVKIDIEDIDTVGDDLETTGQLVVGLAFDLNNIYEMPNVISSARLGMGLGLNSDASLVKVSDVDLKTQNFVRYGREAQRATILLGLGMGFLDDTFGFGFGANVGFTGEGNVMMYGVEVRDGPQYPEIQVKMDLGAAISLVAGLYFSPVKLFSAVEGLEVGVSYRQEQYLKIDPFQAGASIPGFMEMRLVMSIFDYYTPHMMSFGMSYSLEKFTGIDITTSVDLEYQMWSNCKYSTNNNLNYGSLPEFKNILVPKLGVTYGVLSWMSVMAGYYFQPYFIPDSVTEQVYNLLDNNKHVLSVGLTVKVPPLGGLAGPVDVTVGYQFQGLVARDVNKIDQTAINHNYSYGGTFSSVYLGMSLKL